MTPLLSVEHVARSYSRHVVLRDVTFSARTGEVVGVVGPNGAGKTTLLRIVAGLQKANGGAIRVNGRPIPGAPGTARVVYFGGERTMPPGLRPGTWQHLFITTDTRPRTRSIGVLSRGMRQLLGLETVLAIPGSDLILLDEPWEGLDPDAARWLTGAIRAARDRGAAVLASSHRLHDLAAVCDRCLFLDRGIVIAVDGREMNGGDPLTGELIVAAFDEVRRKAT